MKVARSKEGMVVAAHPLAARAGIEILAEGGNAVEAATAVSLALGVVEPFASGLGGGAFMMISPNGSLERTEILDGRGRLSSLASEEYVYPGGVMLPWAPKTGPMSISVPGLGRLLQAALQRYGGRLPLDRLAQPAISLAADGFEVGGVYAYCSAMFEGTVRSTSDCARIYQNDGRRYKPGERLIQPDLSRALTLVAREGFEACYTGEIGIAMTRTVNATGPVWAEDDLASYRVEVRRPLRLDIGGHRIVTTPPPSRGGVGILLALTRYDRDVVVWAKTIRSIFREMHPVIGDPEFVKIDLSELVEGSAGPEPTGGTTHFVVVDSQGTVVSTSQTLGHFFGSGVVVGGCGILLNDDVSDMERKPGHPNSIGPRKRPVANMAPTAVFRGGTLRLAVGSPGSLRIFPALARVVANALFEGMTLEQAVASGRIHWEENRFFFEGDIDPESRARAKRELDDPVDERRARDLFFGGVHGVEVLDDGAVVGVADPRRDGVALGL